MHQVIKQRNQYLFKIDILIINMSENNTKEEVFPKEIINIIEKLSPIERKVVPYLNKSKKEIIEKSGLDEVSFNRAIRFLEQKGILKTTTEKRKFIELGTNGIYYKKNHLPERKLLICLEENKNISLDDAKKISKLSENEFKVSLGILKGKALILLKDGKILLQASKEEIIKKFLEEKFIESLPLEEDKLTDEQKYAFEQLKKRKDIIRIEQKQEFTFNLTELGKNLAGKEIKLDLIEELTPEIIMSWNKGKRFRAYDINASVPLINGGKRHFVNQAIIKARKIWLEMGFKEMEGPMIDISFWNFDALFTPQDHSAREMQDTFFIEKKGKLPEENIVKAVKKAHESGISESNGWQYKWKEEEAQKVMLRTHTTSISARLLSSLKESDLPAKYFIIGKVFRNETLDWSHGFEFYQSEGIVADKNINFSHLLGYLQEFYKKMGFSKIKFVPSFFAYTEPSVEIQVYHPIKKQWFELGGAGMFRPEVIVPLLGKKIPVLAWGQGFDRIIMDAYSIKDLREMYSNDISDLRKKRII